MDKFEGKDMKIELKDANGNTVDAEKIASDLGMSVLEMAEMSEQDFITHMLTKAQEDQPRDNRKTRRNARRSRRLRGIGWTRQYSSDRVAIVRPRGQK